MIKFKHNDMQLPIFAWRNDVFDIETGAREQLKNCSNMPMAFHHVAALADVHEGFGMPIGGVVALQDFISPAMVGVDIGCGMAAIKTQLNVFDDGIITTDTLGKAIEAIYKRVPVGFVHHQRPLESIDLGIFENHAGYTLKTVKEAWGEAPCQLGTLGGGRVIAA